MSTDEAIQIPLDVLILDPAYQPRIESLNERGTKASHVAALVESDPDQWPPIVITESVEHPEKYLVIDGFHRVEAARQLGLKRLPAVVSPNASYEDAFELNRAHGLPLSTADRKEFARWLHEQYPELSLRELGRRAGLSHHTVKDALSNTGQFAHYPGSTPSAAHSFSKLLIRYWKAYGGKIDPERDAAAIAQDAVDTLGERAPVVLNAVAQVLVQAAAQIEGGVG